MNAACASATAPILNALTVDVEDYFQVSAFERVVRREDWDGFESRVCVNTERLLRVFDEANVKATFFVLGWVAHRFPSLVREIADCGHEIASHSHEHRLVYELTPAQFRDDLKRSRDTIASTVGRPVVGYRAPSFSITRDSLWALDVLVEEGFIYDASIYPVHHDRYGIPEWPRENKRVELRTGCIWELPGSTVRFAGTNLPIAGGGYFRILPLEFTKRSIRHLNATEGRAAMFYLHPWEIDPDQPRICAGAMSRLRHYRNLHKTESRLKKLLREFRFGTVSQVLVETADLAQHPTALAG